jgi:8-oxo-dGTP pyrophosphatase MutT (NUDIX family)
MSILQVTGGRSIAGAWGKMTVMAHPLSVPGRRVAGAWMVRDGRILVLQRSGGMSDGAWVPPGGNVDPGEEPLDAVIRETREETGLVLAEPRFLRSWVWRGATPIEVHHFAGIAEGPMVQFSHEHYDFEWLRPADYLAKHLPHGRAQGRGWGDSDSRMRQWVEEMRVSAEMVEAWMRDEAATDILKT